MFGVISTIDVGGVDGVYVMILSVVDLVQSLSVWEWKIWYGNLPCRSAVRGLSQQGNRLILSLTDCDLVGAGHVTLAPRACSRDHSLSRPIPPPVTRREQHLILISSPLDGVFLPIEAWPLSPDPRILLEHIHQHPPSLAHHIAHTVPWPCQPCIVIFELVPNICTPPAAPPPPPINILVGRSGLSAFSFSFPFLLLLLPSTTNSPTPHDSPY